jgi:glycosyltransferase involved in cell wall biosynthesis
VVVPTRNRSRLLATTLRSVLWQRDVELSVIVVDDGSTDDTAELIASLGDARIIMVRHTAALGPSAARNVGAGQAQGEWIGFVDDDDVWAPEKLARQVAAAEQTGRDWAYVGSVNIGIGLDIVSGSPPPPPDAVLSALPMCNPIPGGGSNVILRSRLLSMVGGFDGRFVPCEDWELWARLARTGPPAFVSLPLMGYRVHSGNLSLDTAGIERGALLIQQLYATNIDWGRLNRWLAESCLRVGRRRQALSHFAKAAMQGQTWGVASDLTAIVRGRIERRIGWDPCENTRSSESWTADALPWLKELAARGRPEPRKQVAD